MKRVPKSRNKPLNLRPIKPTTEFTGRSDLVDTIQNQTERQQWLQLEQRISPDGKRLTFWSNLSFHVKRKAKWPKDWAKKGDIDQ